jgi:hypothetical protein
MTDALEQISGLLHEAGETHHRVFRIVDGADDDWASWYAQWLIDLSELPDLLGVRPVRSELIYLLVSLDRQMGQADGSTPPQDPRRLPRMPRGHPHRKPSTATTMSTGEPRCPENGQVRFGGRPSEKGHSAPRWRPTLPHVRFGERPGKTEPRKPGHRVPGRLHIHGELTKLGVTVVQSTVWEILRAAGIDPASRARVPPGGSSCTPKPLGSSLWISSSWTPCC